MEDVFKLTKEGHCFTNVQVKLNTFANASLTKDIFKGFPSAPKKVCSEKYIEEELNFLTDMFVQNGHNRNYLNSTSTEKNIKHQKLKTQTTSSKYHRY